MKTILFSRDDFLPISLLIFSTFLMNFGVYLFSCFSTTYFTMLVFFHIFLIYKLKYSKYMPIFKVIKYLLFILLSNFIFCFLAISTTAKDLRFVLKFAFSDFYTVGVKFALIFLLFGLFPTIVKNINNKKTNIRSYKFAPVILTTICLFFILCFFVLTKNIMDLLIGLILVVPYVWYIMTLAIKVQNIELQEKLQQINALDQSL